VETGQTGYSFNNRMSFTEFEYMEHENQADDRPDMNDSLSINATSPEEENTAISSIVGELIADAK
jgi:hypothetical protein